MPAGRLLRETSEAEGDEKCECNQEQDHSQRPHKLLQPMTVHTGGAEMADLILGGRDALF